MPLINLKTGNSRSDWLYCNGTIGNYFVWRLIIFSLHHQRYFIVSYKARHRIFPSSTSICLPKHWELSECLSWANWIPYFSQCVATLHSHQSVQSGLFSNVQEATNKTNSSWRGRVCISPNRCTELRIPVSVLEDPPTSIQHISSDEDTQVSLRRHGPFPCMRVRLAGLLFNYWWGKTLWSWRSKS